MLDVRRLNVALSRAQCLAVLVAAPDLADGAASSLDRMRELAVLSRLRELAIKRSAYEGDYGDLWELQRLVFQQLSIGNSPLGLPGLGGLFSLEQCPDLQAAELWNGPLLRAIKAIKA